MTIDEAMALMTPEAYSALDELVSVKTVIDTSKKSGNDIIMAAFCRAFNDEVIKVESLDEKLIKLLNSSTNTLSQVKLQYLLRTVHNNQPNVACRIYIQQPDMETTIAEWTYTDPSVINFIDILKYVIEKFEITPSSIRTKMCETLKPTIVNNISQLISKVQQNQLEDDYVVSITTITRIVNCYNHLIFAEFIRR